MKSCFGYIRVSTQKQGEGASLEAQKDAIQAFASRHDLQIINWFEEKETAAKSGRPVFNRMLRLLERGKATGLVIHKIDRSARNLKDWAIISELSDKGVGVYFATETLDFQSRGGRLTADIQAVIAADFIRNLREETKKGLNARLKQGLYPFRAPIGYLDTGRGNAKVPCPKTAPLIARLFALYVSGEHSLRSLQHEADRIGLRNLRGGKISLHGIETILRNPFYCGIIEIRRTGQIYNGIHQPLIDAATFRQVEEVKAGRAGKKVTRHNHLYRGLFRCGLCNGPLSPERQKGRVYYRCHCSTCETTTVREDVLEATIQQHLDHLTLDPDDAAILKKQILAWTDNPERHQWSASLQLRINQARQRLERLTDLLIDGAITQDAHDRRRKSITLELGELTQKLQNENEDSLAASNIEKFLELVTSLSLLYKSAKPAEKRLFVENCFSNRTLARKKLVLEPLNWLHGLKNPLCVSFGDPQRDTSRTFNPHKMFEGYERMLSIFKKEEEPEQPVTRKKGVPAWKSNLKNPKENS